MHLAFKRKQSTRGLIGKMKRSQLKDLNYYMHRINMYFSHKDEYLGWTKEKTHFVSKLASLLIYRPLVLCEFIWVYVKF